MAPGKEAEAPCGIWAAPAREDMEVGPRLVQSSQGPCRAGDCSGLCAARLFPALILQSAFQAKSEHLCGFPSLSPTICPTLGHAVYLTPWLQLCRSPGPCSESRLFCPEMCSCEMNLSLDSRAVTAGGCSALLMYFQRR
ncbi:hypothetical protein LEMLEM_LOCUS4427 [Lemmus lemmus]